MVVRENLPDRGCSQGSERIFVILLVLNLVVSDGISSIAGGIGVSNGDPANHDPVWSGIGFRRRRGVHVGWHCISENGEVSRAGAHSHSILSTDSIEDILIGRKDARLDVVKIELLAERGIGSQGRVGVAIVLLVLDFIVDDLVSTCLGIKCDIGPID